MSGQVIDLANLMRAKKQAGEKFVLMLGAGASMGSGVRPTPVIMDELVSRYGQSAVGESIEARFNALWQRSTDETRRIMLKPYLELAPSSGYAKLAALIDAGYFDLVVSFNFDILLESALRRIEALEFKSIIRGETMDEEMAKLIEAREPRVKLAKLHGSLRSSDHFLFAAEEMHRYPEPIEAMLRRVTGGDIIVCGYAFNDNCVIRAFAEQGGSVISVDPGGAPKNLRVFQRNRRSETWTIPSKFDEFFDALHKALLTTPTATHQAAPLSNPFKFLESYEAEDAGALMGRERETERFLKEIERQPPRSVIIIGGPGKAGKSSLAKAALLPALDASRFRKHYLRCRPDIERSLPLDIAAQLEPPEAGQAPAPTDIAVALQRLVQSAGDKRIILVLDQFDRVTNQFDVATKAGYDQLAHMLREHLLAWRDERLTLVLLVADEGSLAGQLFELCMDNDIRTGLMQCLPFSRPDVAEIIRTLAGKAGLDLDAQIVDDLTSRYEQTRNTTADKRFTLAHVQAACHLLVSTRRVDHESYKAFERNVEALHQAINVCDIISFVEDFAWSEAAQLRNLIKVPLLESKERIAEFVKSHYEELLMRAAAQRRRGATPPGHGR